MGLAIIDKGYVIKKLIKQDQHQIEKYVAFQMTNATVNSVEQAWVFRTYEEAFQNIAELVDGHYMIDVVFMKQAPSEEVQQELFDGNKPKEAKEAG